MVKISIKTILRRTLSKIKETMNNDADRKPRREDGSKEMGMANVHEK
jgi:hypothetical protein